MANKSGLISTSISPSLSTASKKPLKCTRTSPPSSIRCFSSVAFRAGPLGWYMLSNLTQTSRAVVQPFTCFNSDGQILKIISDLAIHIVPFNPGCYLRLACLCGCRFYTFFICVVPCVVLCICIFQVS
jgi:hypothetical protein